MDPNATPPSGVTINIPGYTLISELGKGGMATVYLAIQQNFGRKVALKIMSPALNADPTFSERFLREARIVAGLSHPNIVQVYDVGEFDDHHYIAMEYHPGGDLQERIAKGLTIEESVRVIEQIALALDYAHSKGYIHRDVKPDNVLFREDGSAVLTDFGIAKPTSKNTRQMTQVGKVIGTPKYMSPEQARGQELDARSDLYALGVMFFEMLNGEVPFDGEDPIAIGIKHIKDPVPTMTGEAAAFQEAMEVILAKTPEERYQHGRDFVEALEQVAYTHTDGKHRPSRGKLKASPSGRIGRISTPANTQAVENRGRPLLWASLGSAGLLLAGIGVALVLTPQHPWVQQVQRILPLPTANTATGLKPALPAVTDNAPADEPAVIGIPETASSSMLSQPSPGNDTFAHEPVVTETGSDPLVIDDAGSPEPAGGADEPVADEPLAANPEASASVATETTIEPAGLSPVAGTDDSPDATEEPEAPAVDESLRPLIDRLLAEASTAIEQRQLSRPEGQSALDKYNEILSLVPDNAEAQTGIRKVATTYVVMAREATDRNEFKKAHEYLQQARTIAADAAGLASAETALKAAEREAAEARRAAERAATEKAREANQTDLMVARFRITGLLKSAEYHLANNQLATPPGENAWDAYSEVLKLDPSNAAAKAGRAQVEKRMLELLNAAVDSADGEKARELMTQALRIIPGNPRVKQLRTDVDALP